MTSHEHVTARVESGVAWLGFNRPQKRNAYNQAVIAGLDAALRDLSTDEAICCVVLHGDDRAFCSGGDLVEVRELADEGALALRKHWFAPLLTLVQRLLTFPVPTVAAVRGMALAGGLELACCCDFIVTSDDARFGDQHINAGLIPGGGATELLARRVGAQRAKELILTGRRIDGAEAADIGLALWSVPSEDFDARLEDFVTSMVSKRGEALRAVKLLMGPDADLAAVRRETELAARDMSSAEVRALLHSFGD